MVERFKSIKERLKCNKPVPSSKPGKKKMVKGCADGEERLVHFGDDKYSSNYSDKARKNFRARHNCESPGPKTKARYWACQGLWRKSSPKIQGKG